MTKIMGILNTSPDSFNGDGVAEDDAIAARLEALLEGGADIIDIGGQSTRPGADIISEAEELRRVLPAIRLARAQTNLPISIDTFKPAVAQAALEAGANIINDIHGCQDSAMAGLVRASGARVVVMHSRGNSKTMSSLTNYPEGIMSVLVAFFAERLDTLTARGIKKSQLIFDPGIGFAKTAAQSFEITQRLGELKQFGVPLLYAASQKSFIGKALADAAGQPAPPADRAVGTTATSVYAMLHGADIIRVHNAKAAVQARTIVEAILDPTRVRG